MFEQGFPSEYSAELRKVLALLPPVAAGPVAHQECSIGAAGGDAAVKFPYRIYLGAPGQKVLERLSPTGRQLLHCIYTRSHDGRLREAHARALLESGPLPAFAYPYILRLADDYVLEIVKAVYEGLRHQMTAALRRYCASHCRMFAKAMTG